MPVRTSVSIVNSKVEVREYIMKVILVAFLILPCCCGLYIKSLGEEHVKPKTKITNEAFDEWSELKRKLGLTDQKVELLKSQKDQQATKDLLKRFIKENPSYIVEPVKKKEPESFTTLYHSLLNKLKIRGDTLKTSVNFELADKQNNPKRVRRKISLRMVSDMPTDKIDELLRIFNEQHGIDSKPIYDEEDTESDDYNEIMMPISPSFDSDYMYEHLYEDEEDLGAPNKSHHNSEYSSFQDLILQAKRSQWQREIEESKLRPVENDHFV